MEEELVVEKWAVYLLAFPFYGWFKYSFETSDFAEFCIVWTEGAKCEDREKTNNMQQSDVYYQLLSQHVSGNIMPIFRRSKTVCYCIRYTALVMLDVVGSGCCRMRAVLASYNAAPHNRYQPYPAAPEQYTKRSNTVFFLLKMGIMLPETCWDRSW